MFNYLLGEAYRVLRKKSMYIYFGSFALLYLLLVFIRSGMGNEATQIKQDAETLAAFFPAVVGGYLFAAFYTDDLNAKNLTTLIGFGLGKTKIIIAKLIMVIIFGVLIFALIPVFMWAAFSVFNGAVPLEAFSTLYAWALKALLEAIAFSAVSAIIVYGLQRATFGMVTYLLLSLGVIGQLLAALFSWDLINSIAPNLSEHLMSGITIRIILGMLVGEPLILPIVEYLIYVAIAVALSVLAFKKKELEF
ncbi:MAG: hypothetical protein LBG97_10345 [Coriobacteriales bacterium]|jgi:hypothetical protein|nr:hypothetical protein [Coriobacteriales bacterium]